ncbi:unnamed protein product [Hymenolepis diminuta]|uniref:Uncharacterized protein n=1 Tax=Hymenolepis diminuta TaxID=6216 RepID=A0A564Z912_HYMDI|nr:unnamed protein product [Hymenolepis diminuta]
MIQQNINRHVYVRRIAQPSRMKNRWTNISNKRLPTPNWLCCEMHYRSYRNHIFNVCRKNGHKEPES